MNTLKRSMLAAVAAFAFGARAETYTVPRMPIEESAYDVVVVGGSAAAVSAAIAAKNSGARVIVVAPRPALMDDLTGKLLLDVASSGADWRGNPVNDLVFNSLGAPFASYGDVTPLQLKRIGDELLMRQGIPFRLFTAVTRVLRDANGAVAGVETASRDGFRTIAARAVVDATERAHVARAAGARFRPFVGGAVTFERRIIAGAAPQAEGLVVRELPSRNTIVKLQGVPQEPASGSVTGRFFSCSFTLPMKDLSALSLLRVEQKARDLTWVPSLLDEADTVRFFPPDRLEASVPGVYVASLVGERDEAPARARFASVFVDAPAAAKIGRAAAGYAKMCGSSAAVPVVAPTEAPVIAEAEVLVVGLGTGGAPATISAAREGVKTIGLDYLHRMGGLMTEALIGSYCFGYCGGFTQEIDRGVRGFGAVYSLAKAEWFRREARKAGADLWFGCWAVGVEKDGARLAAVRVVLPDGSLVRVKTRVAVDATGNADLAAAAGEETEFIRADELSLQGAGSTQKLLGASYRNTDYSFVDDTDAADLAFFTLRARNSMAMWAWDQAQMVSSRERRRLRGVFSVSVQDAMLGRTYPDIIGVTKSNFDTHGQTFDDQFFIEDPGHHVREVYLPYRCLLPKHTDGLLVIGLGMSAHRDAMPILRMQPDVQNQGYVAGLAAASSLREGVAVRNVEIAKLQKRLAAKGVIPEKLVGAKDSFPLSDATFDRAIETLVDGYKGLPELLTDPSRAKPRLVAAFAKTGRLEYAHLLGLLGDATGADALVTALAERTEWDKGWNYKGMDQFGRSVSWLDSYLIALGRTKAPSAFAAVRAKSAILAETDAYSHFRAVALAFESLGDRRGVVELARLLKLADVGGHAMKPGEELVPVPGYSRYTRHNAGLTDKERSDCLRELCLARALYNLGDDESRLGERTLRAYAADPRRAYATHARKVLAAQR